MNGLVPVEGTPLLIGGKLLPGGSGVFATVNPATEEVLGYAANASPDDLDAAVTAARIAFDETEWSRHHEFRAHCLRSCAT
jgi:aldehyde dehydrogenase (NAD+)